MIPTAKPCVMLFQPFFQTTLKFPVVWVTQCAIYHYNHHGASFLLALQLQAMTTEMVVYHRTDPDEVTFEIKCRTGSVKVQARTIMSGDCSSKQQIAKFTWHADMSTLSVQNVQDLFYFKFNGR